MNAHQPLRTIAVEGDALHARLVAALLAQSLAPHGCTVSLGDLGDDEDTQASILLGPTVHSALVPLGVSADAFFAAGGAQRFHWSFPAMKIWSTPFGVPRGGVDFHHHLHRIAGELTYEALLPFNPAYRFGMWVEKNGPLRNPPVPYGYRLSRSQLLPLIDAAARGQGVEMQTSAASVADLTVTVLGDGGAEWEGHHLTIPTTGGFPELGLYRCVKAVERSLSLLPGQSDPSPQRAEFNRLSSVEDERIGDFAAFLIGDVTRPTVARKLEVFQACGRIPVEDHEVIHVHYWLSAFLHAGITPRDYDRMADRFPADDTRSWIASVLRQMDQIEAGGVR